MGGDGSLSVLDRIKEYEKDLFICNTCRCGFCRDNCPWFRALKIESASARGVLQVIQGYLEGFFKPSITLQERLVGCYMCKYCVERCPTNALPDKFEAKVRVNEIIELIRADLIEKGFAHGKVGELLLNLRRTHNPWGLPAERRMAWTKGLPVKMATKNDSEAFFICCAYSYDETCKELAKNAVTLFNKIDVPFTILGDDQKCCGDMALRLGERELFKLLAEQNISLFEKYGVESIITLSPHDYNTLKNDEIYRNAKINVRHYVHILTEKIDKGELKPSRQVNKKVTFHDPCFLGRYNKIYEEPRKVLESIPGLKLIEMPRNKNYSFCCGGGSGRVLIEDAPYENRPVTERVNEAIEIGADVIATACPLCYINFKDAIKVLGLENMIVVKDLMELMLDSL
jgi:Fe-S oxidoreductase